MGAGAGAGPGQGRRPLLEIDFSKKVIYCYFKKMQITVGKLIH